MRCTLWRVPAQHLAESLRRGDRVIVVGRLRQRQFDTRDGDKRTVIDCDATEVGASLTFRPATLTSRARTGAQAPADSPGGDDEPPFSPGSPAARPVLSRSGVSTTHPIAEISLSAPTTRGTA
jgi:single-strand DNA-binding protein